MHRLDQLINQWSNGILANQKWLEIGTTLFISGILGYKWGRWPSQNLHGNLSFHPIHIDFSKISIPLGWLAFASYFPLAWCALVGCFPLAWCTLASCLPLVWFVVIGDMYPSWLAVDSYLLPCVQLHFLFLFFLIPFRLSVTRN